MSHISKKMDLRLSNSLFSPPLEEEKRREEKEVHPVYLPPKLFF
jgi:hypothetical protein